MNKAAATVSTSYWQAEIDAAVAPGGSGHVRVSAGVHVIGTLHLRSNLHLELAPGAVLLGSPRIEDYEDLGAGFQKDLQPYRLIVAHGCENLRVSGPGRVDGNGPAFWEKALNAWGWYRELARRPSPMLEFKDCRRLQIEGVEIANSPGWTLHLKRCDDVTVRGATILNDLGGPNTDGIDIDGCRDVRVSDCLIQAGDDAIVLKTTPDSRSCERVTVTNCSITTRCRALKLGSRESYHDMRDVVFSNCVVRESVAIFGLYCRNGATLENIAVSNIVGHAFANPDYNQPIHIDLARWDDDAKPGRIRNVTVDNVLCHSNGRVLITGEPGHPVENIRLRGVTFFARDTFDPHPHGLKAKGDQFSPRAPEARAARAAFVAQHVRGLDLRDCRVDWAAAGAGAAEFAGYWGADVEGLRIDAEELCGGRLD